MNDDLHKYAGYALINVVNAFDIMKDYAHWADIIVDHDFYEHAIVVAKKSNQTLEKVVADGLADRTLLEAVQALQVATVTLEEVRANKGHTGLVVSQQPYKDSVLQSRIALCKIITWVHEYAETRADSDCRVQFEA